MTTKWTDESIEADLRAICNGLARFPSASELRQLGRNDLVCAITRRGGLMAWSQRLDIPRKHSDSDTGWDGELAAMNLLAGSGLSVVRSRDVKAPFDLLVNDLLRVDVKAARHACYGADSGWFYRLGKVPQADLILLWQLDTDNFYALPWFVCPRTNITISADGGKYAAYHNNLQIIREMLKAREAERAHLRAVAATN